MRVFVGGYTRRVTPVPIPNTVVKPAKPMILLQRESRSLPALNKQPRSPQEAGAVFVCAACRYIESDIYSPTIGQAAGHPSWRDQDSAVLDRRPAVGRVSAPPAPARTGRDDARFAADAQRR